MKDPVSGSVDPGKLLYECVTPYTTLRVIDKGPWRYLVFDDGSGDIRLTRPEAVYQSRSLREDPLRTWDPYALAFQIPFLFCPKIQEVFFIGLGGGTIIGQYLHYHPEVRMSVAERDPCVVEVARDYFGFSGHPRLNLEIRDGREALAASMRRFDLVCIDAFGARSIPRHLFTEEFAGEVREHLKPWGMVALNVNGALQGPRAQVQWRIGRSFSEAFPEVEVFPTNPGRPERYQMMLLLAGEGLSLVPLPDLVASAVRLAGEIGLPPGFPRLVGGRRPFQAPEHVEPLRDSGQPGCELGLYVD